MGELSPGMTAIIVSLLAGGGLQAIVALYSARKKAPAERDSIAVDGAEKAVLSLKHALHAAEARAERAERALAERDELLRRKEARIEILESRLDDVQRVLDAVRTELHHIKTAV